MVKGFCVVILLVQLIALLHANDEIVKPCKKNDLECLRKAFEQFMKKTAEGIPKFNTTPIDPLEIAEADNDLPEFEVTHHMRNLKVTGLRKTKINDYQVDIDAKNVIVTMLMNLKIEGEITNDYYTKPKPKSTSGKFDSALKALVKLTYPYGLTEDEKHFTVGQESYTFELQGVPTYNLDSAFQKATDSEPEILAIRSKWAGRFPELLRITAGKLLDKIIPTIVQNIRLMVAGIPNSAFFSNDV